MKAALRARVRGAPPAVTAQEAAADPLRSRPALEVVGEPSADPASAPNPLAPTPRPFTLADTPVEAPRPPALTLVQGGLIQGGTPARPMPAAPAVVSPAPALVAPAPSIIAPAPAVTAPAPALEPATPLIEAAAIDPALPLPERVPAEMALGASLGHLSMRSGPATRAALEELGAKGAATADTVFVAEAPADASMEEEDQARVVLAHEIIHAAETKPAAPPPGSIAAAASEPEATAESVGAALAGTLESAHAPVVENKPPPPPVDRGALALASPGAGGVGLRREATDRPVEPVAPALGAGPASTVGAGRTGAGRAPPAERADPAAVAEAAPTDRPSASERAGAGGVGAAPVAEGAAAQGEAALTVPVLELGSREVDVPAPPPPPLEGEGVDGVVAAFASAPPSQKAFSYDSLGASLDAEAQETTVASNEALPDLHQKMGGEPESGPIDGSLLLPQTTTSGLEGVEGEALPNVEESVAAAPENEDFAANDGLFGWISNLFGASPESNAASIDDAIENIQTVDESVETSAGPPPPVPLEGATDPALIDHQRSEGLGEATTAQTEAATAIAEGPGPEAVQPREMDTPVPIADAVLPAFAQPAPVDGVTRLQEAPPPADVMAAFDEQNAAEMEASVADASSQVAEASTARDEQWEEAVTTAETENQELVDTAQADQEAAVDEQRGRIQDERQDTLERQQEEVDRVDTRSGELQTEQQQEIDDRVEADEAKIETKYDEAEKEAEGKVDEGQKKAEKKKEDAEKEAENTSWWDKLASWITDAINALVDAVTAIIDLVRSAINAVLDAVRSLVVGLIELAASFIKGAIAAFGEALKGLVNGLLGDIFPGLAKALTEVIDGAVDLAMQAVDAVATTLIEGVNAVLDLVQGALNAVLNVLQAAVNLAGGLLTAALTGDWDAFGRKLLEAALQVAGISPDTFYGFIGKVQETFDTIVNDPMHFLGNIFEAISMGFDKFIDTIEEHMVNGFFEWLTGPLGEMGIELPETWDIWGILGLILQVLGLTQQGIRGVVVEELGETAGTIFDFVWRYVDALITGGWEGLWEQIKNDLSNLWEMFVDGIKDWVIEKIITEATLKLLSLLDPTGISAIVQVLLSAWRIYTFMRDNMQRIAQIVTTVVDAVNDIAAGNLQPAADAIDGVLGRLIPVAISLLANLFGLGGVTAKIQNVIEGIREKIRKALKGLIRRVKGMFTGGDAAADPAATPPGEEDVPDGAVGQVYSWTAGGESHRVWVELQGEAATVKMASGAGDPIESALAEQRNLVLAAKLDPEDESRALSALTTADTKEDAVETTVEHLAHDAEDGEGDPPAVEANAAVTEVGQGVEVAHTLLKGGISARRFSIFHAQSPWKLQTWALADRKFASAEDADPTPTVDDPKKLPKSSIEAFTSNQYIAYMRGEGGIPAATVGPTDDTLRSDLTKARESDLLNSHVGSESSQRYAAVEPFHEPVFQIGGEPGVDADLRAAVGTNLLEFLKALASPAGVSGGVTRARFYELYDVAVNRDFISSRYRGLHAGQHEWLPTDMVEQVIRVADNPDHQMNAVKLVEWQHKNRTPTWMLVFKPEFWQPIEIDDETLDEPQGHTGAVYDGANRPRTRGQGDFHDELREQLSPSKTIDQMADGMRKVAEEWIWDGSPVDDPTLVAPVVFRGPSGTTYAQRQPNQSAVKGQALAGITGAANG